ncbi:MAG: sugar phosphate isomerase/epimerase [Planctomycetes bacterium]|nr:sugar phosphate isomerase/epimerase [Planctomycetota bacterium]
MKLGFVGQFPEAVPVAKEIGATGLPLSINALAERGPEAAAKPIRDAGMSACQIGAFGFNPLSPNRAEQKKQEDMLAKAIPLAAATGCPYLVINSGNYDEAGFMRGHPDNFTDRALDEVAVALDPVLSLAEQHGAKIVIEPMVHCVVSVPERFLALKERVKSNALRVNLDICNFFTLKDMWQPAEAVKRICGLLAGHYDLVHCKDLTVSQGVHIHIDETPLGTGVMDWETALHDIARDLPEGGWFIYEHVKSAEDARAGAKLLRDMAQKEGIEFS